MIEPVKLEKSLENEAGEKLYQALLNHYSLVRDRNDVYVTRAQNLMGFAGIINTILVGLIITMVSNEDVRNLLQLSPNLPYFKLTIIIGFIGYVLSIILGLAAFRTTKYMPIPQINSREFIVDVFQEKTSLSSKHLAMQTYEAISYYDKINAGKYRLLLWATTSLTLAIISTAFLGILILTTLKML